MSEVGLAMPWPAMSGAEPCWACATADAVADVERAAEAEAARERAGEVGEDVAEHVGRHDDVELLRRAHEVGGRGVDDELAQLDVRVP